MNRLSTVKQLLLFVSWVWKVKKEEPCFYQSKQKEHSYALVSHYPHLVGFDTTLVGQVWGLFDEMSKGDEP